LTLTAKLSESGAGLADEDALDVLENEQDTLRCAQQIIKDEGIDADLWVGQKLEGESFHIHGMSRLLYQA
jgi:hypothetical protein